MNLYVTNLRKMRQFYRMVYYKVSDESLPTVTVLAVGVKVRDQIRVGGETLKL